MGGGGHNVPYLLDERGIRKLTPAECFRFQGFPDDFVFPSGMADCHLYKQAGNSVVVPVVRRIAEEIARVLTGATAKS
jgi:DNA (cytosine-5)-methyltransferase 1